MATETTTTSGTTSTEWWKDPAYQNLVVQLINQYQQGEAGDDAAAVTEANLAAVQGLAPTGMDFSAYAPLLDVIGDTSYSRDNAIADSQGFIDQIFRNYENTTLPSLYSNPRASGIYNDTSTELLAGNAYGAAVAEGQANLFQNILAYAGARSQQLDPVLQLMQGQVSNSNALMGANASYTNSLLGAMGASGAVEVANNSQSTQNDIATLGALLNAGAAAYGQYQNSQTGQNDTSSGGSSINNSAMNTSTDQYNYDDEYWNQA